MENNGLSPFLSFDIVFIAFKFYARLLKSIIPCDPSGIPLLIETLLLVTFSNYFCSSPQLVKRIGVA